MKFKKILILALVTFVSAASLSPVSVQASSLLDVISTDTDVRNTDTDINDSSLIDKSMSRIKTGNTEDGSNSSATANSNSGDGVNTNVSSTDVINTEVKDNLNNNSLFNGSKSNSTDNSTYNDQSKDNSTTIVINNNSDNRTYRNYSSNYSDASSSNSVATDSSNRTSSSYSSKSSTRSTSSSSRSTSKSSNMAKNQDATADTSSTSDDTIIMDEDVALASLGNGWTVAHEKPATCTKEGYIVYYNAQTKEQVAEATEALGHSFQAKTEAGSFFSPARTITYCDRCGEIESEEKETPASLPFAGVLGGFGAIAAAIIKKH